MAKFGINFDINYYVEVEAKDREDALEKLRVSDAIDEAIKKGTEGEAHNFDVQEITEG